MKKVLFIISITISTVFAREIRSPLLRDDPGYRLMPLPLSECKQWDLRAWAEPFTTKADSAFCSINCKSNSSDRCPLSTILFGRASFTGAQAFSPASVAASTTVFNGDGTNRTLTCTPLLTTSMLKPCLKFIDHGVMFALQAVRRVKNCFSVGVRASVPYRSFKITYPCNNPPFGGATLQNLCTKPEVINGVPVVSYAYRLDVLSTLPIGCSYPQNLFPVVDYYNTLHVNNNITISNENVTDNSVLPVNARNPISLIKAADGSKPQGQWALPLATAQALPALPANGVTTDPRARFVDGTNYQPLGTDPAAQSELWVVPSVGTTDLVPAALVIRDNINELLETAFSTEQFFQNSCGDCFAPQRAHGIGDLQTEYFVRWQPNKKVYIEGLVGVLFPTGKRIENPKELLLWPTGNNGHYEYRTGIFLGLQPCDYFMFNINSYYTYVAKRKEEVIASYAGATVKNIGSPTIPTQISWQYYLGHADAIFMQPCNSGILGIDVRYELYDKSHDHVTFKECNALDCLGNNTLLNPSVLEERTHVVSHTMRATLFYDTSAYTYDDKKAHWSLFAGYGAVVGGKNIPKEHGPYGGFMIIY